MLSDNGNASGVADGKELEKLMGEEGVSLDRGVTPTGEKIG